MKFIPTRTEIVRDVTTGNGKAAITALHPSPEIRAFTPALVKAYAAFEAQNAAADPILADRKRLTDELNKLRAAKNPTLEYDEARDAELSREIAKLDVALTCNGNAARKLAVDYLLAVVTNPRADEAKQKAAKLALKAHEDAAAALAALEEALARREVFYVSAGRPEVWKHYTRASERQYREGQFRRAHDLLAIEINEFPVGAVQTVADGGEVMTLAELELAQRQAEADRAAATRAAARERNRRVSIIERNS